MDEGGKVGALILHDRTVSEWERRISCGDPHAFTVLQGLWSRYFRSVSGFLVCWRAVCLDKGDEVNRLD